MIQTARTNKHPRQARQAKPWPAAPYNKPSRNKPEANANGGTTKKAENDDHPKLSLIMLGSRPFLPGLSVFEIPRFKTKLAVNSLPLIRTSWRIQTA